MQFMIYARYQIMDSNSTIHVLETNAIILMEHSGDKTDKKEKIQEAHFFELMLIDLAVATIIVIIAQHLERQFKLNVRY